MHRKLIFSLAVVSVAIVFGFVAVTAQGPKPAVPLAAAGSVFTYQGQLKKDNLPVNGRCDFIFRVYDASAGGAQLGPDVNSTRLITNGIFATSLDFLDGVFTGDARWLDIRVRCPDGSGVYTPLLPRQELTAAPYALSLRPGALISGAVPTALSLVSMAAQGTGLSGEADNGTNAWGVHGARSDGFAVHGQSTTGVGAYGMSSTGIGVHAVGGDNPAAVNTALLLEGGALKVAGTVRPAFVLTVAVVSGGCTSLEHPLLNATPTAMILVTPRQDTPTAPATDIRVLYNSGTWYLCSPTLAPDMKYNILIVNA